MFKLGSAGTGGDGKSSRWPILTRDHLALSCLVFAYGSNMCRERMLCRAQSAAVVGVGTLQGYQLSLHKRGVDGSAKADAVYTGKPGDATWGIVFRIDRHHKSLLDKFEFVGIGYDSVEVEIALSAGGSVRAWTYFARRAAIEPGVTPYTWYKAFMVHGARQHGLPVEYIGLLEAIRATPDENPARHQENTRIIER